MTPNSKIVKLIRERIRVCYADLLFAKSQSKYRKDYIEGFRNRLDELILIWHEIHNISFVDACKELNVEYKDVDTNE